MIFVNGLPETECGGGSTMAATVHLRARLPGLLKRLKVASILDAPCGDFNWMQAINFGAIDYTGCDISEKHIERANSKAGGRARVRFHAMDIVTEPLPTADLVFCRDFLQHLPNQMAIAALRNFVATGAKWLLVTSHVSKRNGDIAEPGMFRPLNLKIPPFEFPKSRAKIADPPDSRRFMMLWAMESVAECVA